MIIAIVRHGAREDDGSPNEDRKSNIKQDPALSSLGEMQARATGQYFLKKYLCNPTSGSNQNNVRIISSPFLRTLQTAVNIAWEVNCERIEVWDPICEQLGVDTFDAYPLPRLNYYLNSLSYIQETLFGGKYIDVVRMEDPERIMSSSCYPERKPWDGSDDWNRRVRASIEYLIKTQFTKILANRDKETCKNYSIDEDHPTVLLLVTHAFFLDPFVKYFNTEATHKDWKNCAIGVAEATDINKWKLVENVSSDHLH